MSRNFDGVDDVINCGNAVLLQDLAAMTLSAWINPRTIGENSEGRIITKENATGTSGAMRLYTDTTNRVTFNKAYSGTNLQYQSANNSVPFNVWSHISFTWNGNPTAATAIKMFINGLLDTPSSTTDGGGSRQTDSAQNMNIGNNSGTTRTFDGWIEYVQIFNRVLSQPEIIASMRWPGMVTNGLILFCPLLGGSPEPDLSGYANNGTVTNGAAIGMLHAPINGLFRPPARSQLYGYTTPAATPSPTPTVSTGRRILRNLLGVGL